MSESRNNEAALCCAAPAVDRPARNAASAKQVSRGMIIINADDWGGWTGATDAAVACFKAGRITSVTAMVFMADSERAGALAAGTELDLGVQLNFNQPFTGKHCLPQIAAEHDRVRRFLRRNKYAHLVYNPWLRDEFR